MNKVYSVRFFTRDVIDGKVDDENEIARFESNKYIPIPSVGSRVFLENDGNNMFIVKGVEYAYPGTWEEEYSYDVCVIVEAEN